MEGKYGFFPLEDHNLLREAHLLQVSNYDKMCVKNFEENILQSQNKKLTSIVSIIHKKENKSEFHEPSSFLHGITSTIFQWRREGNGQGTLGVLLPDLGQGEVLRGNRRAEGK